MAKGVEDTAFYCFNRLIGLNEVGSDPGRDGISVPDFHSYCEKMQATRPLTMTTLSTHDTKRSDDVRARLAVLSELPGTLPLRHPPLGRASTRIPHQVRIGRRISRSQHRIFLLSDPDRRVALSVDRAQAYMLKAVREAKQHTSWVANNKEFEDALNSFIERTLAHEPFIAEA